MNYLKTSDYFTLFITSSTSISLSKIGEVVENGTLGSYITTFSGAIFALATLIKFINLLDAEFEKWKKRRIKN